MPERRLAILVAIGVVLITGCSRSMTRPGVVGPAKGESARPALACPRVAVVGLDRTASYALSAEGRRQVAELIVRFACSGDTWYLRWISNDSYSDRAIVMTLRLPRMPPTPSNPFDRRGRTLRGHAENEVVRAKQSFAARLLRLPQGGDIGTDVWGFLVKASELLAGAPDDVGRMVIVVSDLGDTLKRRRPLDLGGARVYVTAFQSGGDAGSVAKRRAYWEQVLRDADAQSVTFIDPSQIVSEIWERDTGEQR